MRIMRIAFYVAICAGPLMGFSACSAKGNSNPNPTGPSASLMSVAVSGQTPLMAGTTTQFRAMAKYSDGSSNDVTSESTWSSSAPPFATVSASGMVTAIKPGNLQINASFQSMTNALPISVMPSPGTPWSQLPPLSEAAKNFIVSYNLNYVNFQGGQGEVGTVKRWNNFPIPIYADPGFRAQDLVDATNLWQSTTGGKITFRIVSDPAAAAIVFDFQWPPPGNSEPPETSCGSEGPHSVVNNVILTGGGHYAFGTKPSCGPRDGDHRIGLAHGIGHILGLGGHTASDSDLMGNPASIWYMSPLLSEIINWLYSVPAGTRPI